MEAARHNRIFNLGAEITASSGGTGNQGEGESVALFCGAERSGGSRPIWALNTVTQVDSGQKSNAAIGVEVDINNNSGTDSGGTSSSSDQMMGIQVISGGSNRPYIGVAVTADTANNTWLVGGLLGNFNKIGLQISNGDADCVGLKYIGSSGGGDTAILCQDSSGDNTLEVTGSGAVNIQAVSNPSAGYALTVRTGTDENFEVIPGESLSVTGGVGLNFHNDANNSVVPAAFNASEFVFLNGGLVVGSPTGGNKGAGTINVASGIYRNNSAYTNPDYVFERHFTGKVERYAENPGASPYVPMTLEETEAYAKENFQLPRVAEKQELFSRADILLEKIEELYLHIFDLNRRIKELEARATLTTAAMA